MADFHRLQVLLSPGEMAQLEAICRGIGAHKLVETIRRILRWLARHPEVWSEL